MASALARVISAPSDSPKPSDLVPPQTEAPFPESTTSNQIDRLDSDTTLTESQAQSVHSVDETHDKDNEQTKDTSRAVRPGPLQKFETEILPPVGARPFIKRYQHSTGGNPSSEPFKTQSAQDQQRRLSDELDSDASSDEDNHNGIKSRLKQRPHRYELSKAHLNQVQRHPRHDRLSLGNEHFHTRGKVAKDGRLNIALNETANSGFLAKTLGATIKSHLHPHAKQAADEAEVYKKQYAANKGEQTIPRMNIVVMVIGSRGDIQPFLKIGKILQDKYGHRVRIATHPAFKKFIEEDIGLEFFSVGGDPSELMSFMVKNPGLIPSFETVKAGEIGRRREQMYEMFQGFWRACINTTDNEKDTANLNMLGHRAPFVADAIIANPPSFAHFHCAQKLGIPLHLVFTFPYSPTSAFPHPLANIKASNVDREYSNFMSYPLVELMVWQGLGDLVNRFRIKTLGLEPVSTLWAPGQGSRMKIPMTYLWSPGLVPKPADWGPEIEIAGYVFLDLATSYTPPEDLKTFLDTPDERPLLYIGFGSISGLDDPKAFCEMIFEAVAKAKVRAIISRGWGGMGDGLEKPDGVFLLDNVPHDWLFPQVDAVVHHGGAGTTAAGLRFGKPTMIVPFFGDQPFWAAMIARAGAGAKESLPLKKLDSDKFAEGIRQCLEPEAKQKAQEIAKSIEAEGDGAENAVDSFHRSLSLDGKHSMRCSIFESRVAVWKVKHTALHLSALAADLLIEHKQLSWADLSLLRHKDWTDFRGPGEPITGVGGVMVASLQEAVHGLTSISDMTKKDMKRIDKRKRKGKTVADAITLPGVAAGNARKTVAEPAQLSNDVNGPLNLEGDAEPPRHLTHTTEERAPVGVRAPVLRTTTTSTSIGETLPTPVVIARDVGIGVGHSTKALAMLPLDMLTAITLGFRNAPRLYGDRTVRRPPRPVKGFRAGWETAGKELWFGFYDGVTGVVRIPTLDVQEEGFAGLPKGIVRGVGGLILKPIAGILGVPTYTTRGCVASVRKRFRDTQKTKRWIRRARMSQGGKEMADIRKARLKAASKPDGQPAAKVEDLEEVRSHVLSRWTTNERQMLEEAREQERKRTFPSILLSDEDED